MMISIGLASIPEEIEQPEDEETSIYGRNSEMIFTYDTVDETLIIDPATYSKKEYDLNELLNITEVLKLIIENQKRTN